MGKNRFLTEYERGRIDQGLADGKSQREISILISNLKRLYLRNKEGYGKNFVQGRPCINDEKLVRALESSASCNKGSTALQLKRISGASGEIGRAHV